MIKINNSLISIELIEENFTCNIEKCKGACCVQGDSGAPLLEEEVKILKDIFPVVKEYLQPAGIEAIEKQGVSYIDEENEHVTQLINGKECAFTFFYNGIAQCGIEKAFTDKKINFQKPVSCHLYPVRIRKYAEYDAVNYDRWDICKPAISLGNQKNTPLFKYVKNALLRKFGENWCQELKKIAENNQYKKAEKSKREK